MLQVGGGGCIITVRGAFFYFLSLHQYSSFELLALVILGESSFFLNNSVRVT